MKKIQLQIFTLVFSFSAISYILYSPEVSAQSYGRYLKPIGNFLGDIIGRIRPEEIRPMYRIIKGEVDKYGKIITYVGYANTTYMIYFDCTQGLVSGSIQNLPLEQRHSLYTKICGSLPRRY